MGGLGSVLLPMTTPAVMTEGGIYLMYYFGGNYEETNISLYSNNPAIPSEAKIKGMTMRIGVAVSQDGETWGRVEGDHPTNACMVPYDKSDPSSAMSDNNEQEFDSKNLVEELYCAWPEVVVQIVDESDTANANKRGRFGLGGGSNNNAANTGDEKSGFFMYYSTMTKDTKTKAIAYAVSEDGFRWFKRGLCIMNSKKHGPIHLGIRCFMKEYGPKITNIGYYPHKVPMEKSGPKIRMKLY